MKKLRKESLISFILSLMMFSTTSCQNMFERFFNNRQPNSEFKYYANTPKQIPEILDVKSFYYHQNEHGVMSYLAFYSDGFVSYFGSTSMQPDTIHEKHPTIMRPERKKNGQPKKLTNDFGYYTIKADSILLTVDKLGVLGNHTLLDFKGKIYKDSIIFHTKTVSLNEFESEYDFEKQTFLLFK